MTASITARVFAFSVACGVLLAAIAPLTTNAQVYYFNPQTGAYSQSPTQVQAQSQNTWSPYQYQIPATGTIGQTQYQLIYIQQLQALIAQLEALLNDRSYNYDDDRDSVGNSDVEVTTLSATDIDDDRARLRGEVDFNSSNVAYVWFEFGQDEDDLDDETPRIRRDDDEDFAVTVTRLEEDERYYFRAAGRDDDGRIDFGSTRSFTTDDDGDNDDDDDHDDENEPDVETGDATDIDVESATLEGEVDMNDFEDGLVFLVYGEDEDQVEDIEDEFDSYDDIDEDGDDLQKVQVDSSLDDDDSYEEEVSGLNSDTEYFYAYCVEYEDEDNDETIVCGSVESFDTDDN